MQSDCKVSKVILIASVTPSFKHKLIPSNLKFRGILMLGISASVKAKVRLHCEQWKCVCFRRITTATDWQSAYFTTPVPSSMVWISLCSKNVFKVLNKVTLSAFQLFCQFFMTDGVLLLHQFFYHQQTHCCRFYISLL